MFAKFGPEGVSAYDGQMLTISHSDPNVFPNPNVFAPERWLDDENAAHRHQFVFGIGGRMCVASHLATKALYSVLLHLIAHFQVIPVEEKPTLEAIDPLRGLLALEKPQAQPKIRTVRFVPRSVVATKAMLSQVS